MGIPTSSWACSTSSWAAPAQRTGTDLPATLVCLQLGILHQQLGLLGRLPAGLSLERPVWSSHCLDTWLLLRLRSCTRTALAQGWTDGRAGRAGRTRQQRCVLDCPRVDFRVKSLPMGRYPLIGRSRRSYLPVRAGGAVDHQRKQAIGADAADDRHRTIHPNWAATTSVVHMVLRPSDVPGVD